MNPLQSQITKRCQSAHVILTSNLASPLPVKRISKLFAGVASELELPGVSDEYNPSIGPQRFHSSGHIPLQFTFHQEEFLSSGKKSRFAHDNQSSVSPSERNPFYREDEQMDETVEVEVPIRSHNPIVFNDEFKSQDEPELNYITC